MFIRNIGLVSRTYRHIGRYRQILTVLFKYGFGDLVDRLNVGRYLEIGAQILGKGRAGPVEAYTRYERIRMAFEELGPTFIKMGQILSTRPDLIPVTLAEELSKLQDSVPPFPFGQVKDLIEAELDADISDIFMSIEETPLAAASIAQVHRARLLSGRDVVVKVRRPGIERTVSIDLEILLHLAGLAERHPVVPATLYNSAVLIGPQGEIAGVHHKCHIPAEEKHYFYPGSTTDVYRTEIGTLGLMVCYDSEFPELPRVLALKGAEILVAVYNWGWKRGAYGPGRLSRVAAVRALENQVFFLACGKVGEEGEHSFYGNSTVAGPSGEILFESKPEHDEKESVIRLTLERRDLVRTRAFNTTFRNRRPELYGSLGDPF